MTALPDKYLVDLSKDSLQYAFDGKFVGSGVRPAAVAKEEIESKYKEILQNTSSNGCVVYIHIPFCQQQCSFCGFAGSRATKEEGRLYINALIKEIELISQYQYPAKTPVQAIYLGGGTPSAIEPEYLNILVENCRKYFNLANDCEITLEGRTHDFEGERGRELANSGFSRFSIGVQTFDTKIRKTLGRVSEKEKVIEILADLASYNKAAVIIDLMYALPAQSVEMFIEDLKMAASAKIDGLDTYRLKVFEDSRLKKAILTGSIAQTPELSMQGAFYKAAYDWLIYNQWYQISLNHYARTHRERNIYNSWVKKKAGCIAIGAGAGGSIDGWSYYRAPVAQKYIKSIEAGNFSPDSLSAPSEGRLLANKVSEQIENGYLNVSELFAIDKNFSEKLSPYLENWSKANLIKLNDNYANLTTAGKFWGVNITQAIINILK
ncbi:MAG: heme anaerobic degradation radical SAM methyltransferase ChuW/HutW [Endomicrobium sp.]|jgi:oxygen-independent coproporphyrinogen-3 oxidase|nr:heme anaerobic degradation radical SAM methyltransferase ChuW/HutW [Endomicrobium sp.]